MKKYVQNIEKFYGGETANAIMLRQVESDFPKLIGSIDNSDKLTKEIVSEWVSKYRFNPWVDINDSSTGQTNCKQLSSCTDSDIELLSDDNISKSKLNEKILGYNLLKQKEFIDQSHTELYMMDDTSSFRSYYRSFSSDKLHLHNIQGWTTDSISINGINNDHAVSSQMNVLFPAKKISSKSLYSNNIGIQSEYEIDDILEMSMGISLQSKVSSQNCFAGIAMVGNNMYMLSPNIGIGIDGQSIYGNGLSVVNGYGKPFYFPHTLTLFQPSQDRYLDSTQQEFIDWYKMHNHRTILSLNSIYGSNVSTLKLLGSQSYELELATYGPTGICLSNSEQQNIEAKTIELSSEQLRQIRAGLYSEHYYESSKYMISHGDYQNVGLMFNLYTSFISGGEKIIQMSFPSNEDFNEITFEFDWRIVRTTNFIGELEVQIAINDDEKVNVNTEVSDDKLFGHSSYTITDSAFNDHILNMVIRIFYEIDYTKRNSEQEYRSKLLGSGLVIENIRVTNGFVDDTKNLTFGSYINENGISQDERYKRYNQFLVVSKYKENIAYQTVMESSLKNMTSSGITYKNNYSSGDMYGDIFVTKSVLNSAYDMEIDLFDDTILRSVGRDYIGLGECSNQLSLVFNQAYIYMSIQSDGMVDIQRQLKQGDSSDFDKLKYQRVETVKNINRFESSIKHKSNVFSVVVQNSNLAENPNINPNNEIDVKMEKYKEQLRNSVTQFIRNTCQGIVPVHTQLFDVQFT